MTGQQALKLKPCPCGGTPELVDHRIEWFVRCNECKPFATVIYGESAQIDHAGIDCETDEEADAAHKAASDVVDWGYIRQSAIDAWNAHADLAEADALETVQKMVKEG